MSPHYQETADQYRSKHLAPKLECLFLVHLLSAAAPRLVGTRPAQSSNVEALSQPCKRSIAGSCRSLEGQCGFEHVQW